MSQRSGHLNGYDLCDDDDSYEVCYDDLSIHDCILCMAFSVDACNDCYDNKSMVRARLRVLVE